jgi:hypothetical protein
MRRREFITRCVRGNDINLEPNEFVSKLGQAVVASLRPAILDPDVVTLDPAEFSQSRAKKPDDQHSLLRAHRNRPGCSTAEQPQESGHPNARGRS